MEPVYREVTVPLYSKMSLSKRDSEISVGVSTTNRRALSLVLSLLALFILAATALLVIVRIVDQKRLNSESQDQTRPTVKGNGSEPAFACVPCLKLLHDATEDISSDPLLRKLTIEVKDDREDCCAYNAEQIEALFESVARLSERPGQQLNGYNVSDFTFSPVSAHKRLYPARISREFGIPEIPVRPPLCEFKEDDPRWGVEHHRGVDILRRGLRVRYAGLYYVYASILFRPQSSRPCREFKYQTFTAHVEKVSCERRLGSQVILRASHTCCDSCINSRQEHFMSGVFVLLPGDVIRVRVMGYELVHFNPYSTFAGLAMLGSPDLDVSSTSD